MVVGPVGVRLSGGVYTALGGSMAGRRNRERDLGCPLGVQGRGSAKLA